MVKALFLLLLSTAIFADEKKELGELAKLIEKYNEAFVSGPMIVSDKDEVVRSVNYYTKEGDFKKLLKLQNRSEIVERSGDRRRWFVSKWQGKQPAIYVSADYTHDFYDDDVREARKQATNLKDYFLFYFKNYCEFEGSIDARYARIKKMRLTYFDAPYTAVNNMMNFKVVGNFKKVVSYDIDLKEDDKIIDAMQTYFPIKPTTLFGNIFAIQLKVLEVYPGEKNMPLCTSDYYMGRKGWGSYEKVLSEIDELPELKGKRNPY